MRKFNFSSAWQLFRYGGIWGAFDEALPVLLRNVNPDHYHWVEMKLIGGPKSPRDAVGASVYLTANRMRQRGDVLSGGS